MPREWIEDAMRAKQVLEGSGMSLQEAARMALGKLLDPRQGERFRTRYDRVMATGETMWSATYASQMARIPQWLGAAGMRARCGELSPARIEELVRAQGPRGGLAAGTVRMRVARIRGVMGETVTRRQGGRRRQEVRILSRQEVDVLLEACESREARWAVGLLVFAGIRPYAEAGEIARLDWRDVSAEHVYVPAEAAKTGQDRYVPMTPALGRTIAGHPSEGAVRPPNWKREWSAIRKRSGIAWQADLTRHSFASHFLAWRGELATKAAMGHSAGSAVLFRHYRRAVTQEDGAAYFA